MNSRVLTNYLKGFAIIFVMVDHFSGQFLTRDYGWINGYANGFVAIFFMFSGFGLFYSFEKRFSGGSSIKALGLYFFDRAIKIYPLYWLSLLIAPWVFPGNFEILHETRGFLIYLGLPFLGAPWLYWFMTALFQCYLIAPLVYYIFKKIPLGVFLAGSAIIALIATPLSLLPETQIDMLEYRYFLGAHIILFGIGMALSPVVARYKKKVNNAMLAGSLVAFFLSVYVTRTESDIFSQSHVVFIPLMVLCTFALGITWLSLEPALPLQGVFGTLGQHAYSLYLFHIPFYCLLSDLGLLKNNQLMSIEIIIVLLPLFVFLCIKAECGFNFLTSRTMILIRRLSMIGKDFRSAA
ncbi:MAG: acyltransferase family protein [Thermoleophilia bacterium]